MESEVILITGSRGNDPVADTARHCLCHEMKIGQRLQRIERWEYWRFIVSGLETQELRILITDILERTRIFVNPYKHRYRTFFNSNWLHDIEQPDECSFRIKVLVKECLDLRGPAALSLLKEIYPGMNTESIKSIQTGILWILDIVAESAALARFLAEELTILRNQHEGLLMNPHSQTSIIF